MRRRCRPRRTALRNRLSPCTRNVASLQRAAQTRTALRRPRCSGAWRLRSTSSMPHQLSKPPISMHFSTFLQYLMLEAEHRIPCAALNRERQRADRGGTASRRGARRTRPRRRPVGSPPSSSGGNHGGPFRGERPVASSPPGGPAKRTLFAASSMRPPAGPDRMAHGLRSKLSPWLSDN